MSNRLAAHAAALARRGWPVLPCHSPAAGACSCGGDCPSPAKHPRTRRGLHQASCDPAQVTRWWRRWPEANLAVRTGAGPAGAGLVVLDVDPGHGGEASLVKLLATHEALPVTLEVATGGGGRHLYFAHPGGRVPNSTGRLGPGLDLRGDGGYVMAPPSAHPSGRRYRWRSGPLAPMPDWLHRLALAEQVPVVVRAPQPVSRPGAWAGAALVDEVTRVRRAPEGCRNDTLNRAAFALGQLVGGGHLEAGEVAAQLTDAGVAAGLGGREVASTIASGLRAGAAAPRHPLVR